MFSRNYLKHIINNRARYTCLVCNNDSDYHYHLDAVYQSYQFIITSNKTNDWFTSLSIYQNINKFTFAKHMYKVSYVSALYGMIDLHILDCM